MCSMTSRAARTKRAHRPADRCRQICRPRDGVRSPVMPPRSRRIGAMVCGLALALSACTALADAAVPYKDTNVAGTIGLCDRTGKAIHHGKVSDGPFVWLAASSSPARAPYDGYGKSATLYAYQPLQRSPPEDWRGDQPP